MSRQEKSPHSTIQSQIFSVGTVRNILDLDNKGIAKLCAQVSLMPKKDMHGRTYFTKEDIEILTRIKKDNESNEENVAVVTDTGKLITTYGKAQFDDVIIQLLKLLWGN